MDYKIVTPANSAPVSVAELNTHLQLFGDNSYDGELADLILTAQGYVSDGLGEFVSNTVIQVPVKDFSQFDFKHKNVKSVSVSYYDVANSLQTLGSENYVLDETGTRFRIVFTSAPTTSTDFQYPAYVEYTTGFDTVPTQVRHAILLTAAELFHVRSEGVDKQRSQAQITVGRLLASNRRVVV